MSVLNDMALKPSEKEVAEAEGLLAFIEESPQPSTRRLLFAHASMLRALPIFPKATLGT